MLDFQVAKLNMELNQEVSACVFACVCIYVCLCVYVCMCVCVYTRNNNYMYSSASLDLTTLYGQ